VNLAPSTLTSISKVSSSSVSARPNPFNAIVPILYSTSSAKVNVKVTSSTYSQVTDVPTLTEASLSSSA